MHSCVHPEVGGLGIGGDSGVRGVAEAAGTGLVGGQHHPSGKARRGWRRLLQSWRTCFSLSRDHSGVGVGGGKGGKKADTELKESMFPAVCPWGFRQKDCTLSSGNPRLEDPTTRSWGTPKAQGAKHTPPSTVLPPPPSFKCTALPRLVGSQRW